MNFDPHLFIGGLGGSGTRVYAEILKQLGICMGKDLNPENDYLLFTRLFKQPEWYVKADQNDIFQRLSLFKQITVGENIDKAARIKFNEICKNNKTIITNPQIDLKAIALNNKEKTIWGWKEPNSYFLIKEISNHFPNIKFILVVREAKNMALSKNKQQLKNWGELLFNFERNENGYSKLDQLNFWIEANNRALKLCEKYMPNRYIVSRLEDLYIDPKNEIDRITNFLDYNFPEYKKDTVIKIPINPRSANRYETDPFDIPSIIEEKLLEINANIKNETKKYINLKE